MERMDLASPEISRSRQLCARTGFDHVDMPVSQSRASDFKFDDPLSNPLQFGGYPNVGRHGYGFALPIAVNMVAVEMAYEKEAAHISNRG